VERNGWGDTMPTYKDLVELARICLSQARTAHNSEASAALLRLAREYSSRAAELDSTKKTRAPRDRAIMSAFQ
jgi:hypothetical protein